MLPFYYDVSSMRGLLYRYRRVNQWGIGKLFRFLYECAGLNPIRYKNHRLYDLPETATAEIVFKCCKRNNLIIILRRKSFYVERGQ